MCFSFFGSRACIYIYSDIYVLSETDPRERQHCRRVYAVGDWRPRRRDNNNNNNNNNSQIVQQQHQQPRHKSAFQVLHHYPSTLHPSPANIRKSCSSTPFHTSPVISVSVLHLRSRNCGFNQSNWIPTSSTCRDYIAATGGLRNYSSVWRTRRLPFRHSRQ